VTNSSAPGLNPARMRWLQRWSRAAGGFAVLTGVLALVGWRFDLAILKSLIPGQVAMNPLTALASILAGIALWLIVDEQAQRSRPAWRWAMRLCAALAALAGLLRLVAVVFGWDSGIDQLLFREKLGAGSPLPNRMAPNTALDLLLLGLALLVLDAKKRWRFRPTQMLALLVTWSALLALVGYLYGTGPLNGLTSYIPMALPTALTLLVLGLGLLGARPRHGMMAIVASDSVGGIVTRRLLPAALLFPLILGWLRLRGQLDGLYDTEVGVATFAMSNVLVLLILVLWNARMLHRMDLRRMRDAEALRATTAAAEQARAAAEQAKQQSEAHAAQLALASRYKSEFLANMSHELRTPLNSLLILSQQLAKNVEGNLTPKQVEYAGTIHGAGADLLALINDILDLAKIESGTVALDIEELSCVDLAGDMERSFRHVADARNVHFWVELEPGLPRTIFTDRQRLQQVLNNLLANAFKFTPQGRVVLRIAPAGEDWHPYQPSFERGAAVAFSVSDTGIGIPLDKQQLIFEAFQQVDGSTSRKYGGTGLGLSISRELARLLGGEIHLASTPGKGTTFTLFLPRVLVPHQERGNRTSSLRGAGLEPDGALAHASREPVAAREQRIEDDRAAIEPGDQVLLIVEDDPTFARVLLELARENGFRGVVATRGDDGLALARELAPAAISLDLNLPGIDGRHVLERLKDDPRTRHIPVQIISVEDELRDVLRQGAVTCLTKPVSKETLDEALVGMLRFAGRPVKRLLVVEDNDVERSGIVELLRGDDIELTAVATGAAALAALESARFDCLVLDLGLPDISGFELVMRIRKQPELRSLAVIVYTAKNLTRQEEEQLKPVTRSVILKGAQSSRRLQDETTLFLHRIAGAHNSVAQPAEQAQAPDSTLAGHRVLIVDDDIRNIFSLTSVLERDEMEVLSADTAREGIELLQREPGIDIVLMDLMMPEMDGYQAIAAIRSLPRCGDVPIIAVTAKAMKGEREKVVAAGASDYLTKPVDVEQLRWLLGRWLGRQVEQHA